MTDDLPVVDFDSLSPKDKRKTLASYYRRYPDKFIDEIKEPNSNIDLYFYQRIHLRILFRYTRVFITATRGTSKSYTVILAFVLKCIMFPGIKLFICARGKEQASKITQERLEDIFEHYPLLRQEVRTLTEQKDYTRVVFHNGSSFDVVQVAQATRGGRRHGGCGEEISDKNFDGDTFNEVVIPLMANNRPAKCGGTDPNELHKSEAYICTAGTRQQFAYELAKEIYGEMLEGESAFYLGNSYELPCLFGQLEIDFVESKRLSPTYPTESFLREFGSIWTGSSNGALVSDINLRKSRTVGIAEYEHCGDTNCEYVLSYDVARHPGKQNALSCLTVIKITPREDGLYTKEAVNVYSMEGQHDTRQAKFLKQKVHDYKARILIVDIVGIGSGVVDQLVLDLGDGFPPYGVINNEEYDKYKDADSIPMVFAMDSRKVETRNSKMMQNIMKVFNAHDIALLKTPHEGLKDYRKHHKLTQLEIYDQPELEIPYIMTDSLCEEIMNLEYRSAGNEGKIVQISSKIPKDKFMALMYGLWWIHMQERVGLERKGAYEFLCLYN